MLNNKGYTLVELLATVIILGVIMAVTIPNISGISEQNKITTYAEDAKKFKNTAEYMFRGDDTIIKPVINNECIIVNLQYLHGNDFDNPPYGGEYQMDKSYVVMAKRNNRYHYYVQLVEKFRSSGSNYYAGFRLLNSTELDGDDYLEKLTKSNNLYDFVNIDLSTVVAESEGGSLSQNFINITGCNKVLSTYYPGVEEDDE